MNETVTAPPSSRLFVPPRYEGSYQWVFAVLTIAGLLGIAMCTRRETPSPTPPAILQRPPQPAKPLRIRATSPGVTVEQLPDGTVQAYLE